MQFLLMRCEGVRRGKGAEPVFAGLKAVQHLAAVIADVIDE